VSTAPVAAAAPLASWPRAGAGGAVVAAVRAMRPAAGVVASLLLYAIACPPHEWSLAAWIAPGLLLTATRTTSPGRALLCGLLFGGLFGIAITGWTYHATLTYFGSDRVRATAFVLVMWLVYAGVPYGLLIAAYGVVARRLAPIWLPPVGAWLWVASEWLRSTMLTGLPWELLGDTQFRNLVVIQIAELGGVYAVSFVVALLSIGAAEALRQLARGGTPATAARVVAVPVAVLTATLAYGAWAGAAWAPTPDAAGARTIAVVQARIPTELRWKRAFFNRTLAAYGMLTREAGQAPLDLIVWPENAANFYLSDEPMLTAQLGTVAAGATEGLIVGGPRLGDDGLARNAAYLLTGEGKIRDAYDKHRLVPFAEYDPFRAVRPSDGGDPDTYVAGADVRPIAGRTMSLGTMICYEALFPHLVRELVRGGADVLVNISNDAWLDPGDGSASRQHFSHVVFRAIENRRYMVRASDRGVCGFAAPSGAIYSVVADGTEGAAVGQVVPLHGTTPYGRFGDAWIALGGLAVAAIVRRRGERVA
jgi:apolipoprotein N-acyltransferase